MAFFTEIFPVIWESIVSEFVAVILGIIFVYGVQKLWLRWRFGGWHVVILEDGEELLRERISPERRKEIVQDRLAARVLLKGLVSSYGWLHCDLLIEGKEKGLYSEDKEKKHIVINLDHDPGPEQKELEKRRKKHKQKITQIAQKHSSPEA